MKKLISLFVPLIAYLFLLITSANAAVSCQPIYGGGQTCVETGQVRLNKQVQNPQTKAFEDNLDMNEAKHSPDSVVVFKILITNIGGTTLPRVVIQDVLPSFVKDVAGPGSFDANTRNLSFEELNLAPNETRERIITARVVSAEQIPLQAGSICVVNQAIALMNNQPVAQANSQFCIQKEVPQPAPTTTKGGLKVLAPPPVTTTPPTGPEALALFAMIPTGIAGNFLRKWNPTSRKFRRTRGGEK